jgi:cytochrome c peroxidase
MVAAGVFVTICTSAAIIFARQPPVVTVATGVAADDTQRDKAQTAPLSKARLEQRKRAAEQLAEKSTGDSRLRHSESFDYTNLSDFVRDVRALRVLGKALFWDQRVGSDDRTACATCHYHAGVDTRTKHTDSALVPGQIRVNHQWTQADHTPESGTGQSEDFGLILAKNGDDDQTLVIGSQGIRLRMFEGLTMNAEGIPVEKSRLPTAEELESLHYLQSQLPYRSVSRRNAATVINSTLLSRLFHDGRASDEFNGHDGNGAATPLADEIGKFVVRNQRVTTLQVRIPRAAAASQAVVPLVSDQEMSWHGRRSWHVALKLLDTQPLLLQQIHKEDSLLAPWTHATLRRGLNTTYRKLIEQAFVPALWQAPNSFQLPLSFTDLNGQPLKGTNALHAANFSLFFGLAIMAYEQTLVSDDSPWDRFSRGDTTAMSLQAISGMQKFQSYGCGECHSQPEFAGATTSAIFGSADPPDVDYDELPLGMEPLEEPINPDGHRFIEPLKPVFEGPESHSTHKSSPTTVASTTSASHRSGSTISSTTPAFGLTGVWAMFLSPGELPIEYSRPQTLSRRRSAQAEPKPRPRGL